MDGFLRLARERKLDRIGAAYAVAAWAIVQGASIALPAFDAPAWVMRWLIIVAIAAFPVTLALAWHVNEGAAAPAGRTGVRRVLVPAIMAAIFIASTIPLALHWSRDGRGEAKVAPAVRAASQMSIAVLPFANLSGDPAKRYFSDGIADQLITELSRRRNLRVAARSSSFAFSGNQDIKNVARTLGVAAVVEGSVREDGNRVRIVAELINAADGFQIWSESYDRDLTNILALQDDIARAISHALSEKLTGDAGPEAPRQAPARIDPQAYRDYLQGQFYYAQRSEEGIYRAIALFKQVTERAPNYADAFAALGGAHATLALNFTKLNEIGPADLAIAQALKLDPSNSQGLMARATASLVEWKWREAADDIMKVEANDAGAPGLWHEKGVFLSYMGLTGLALPAVQKAVAQDPLSYIDRYNLALYLLNDGRKDEAIKVAREGVAIQPGNAEGQALICQVEAARNNLREAKRVQVQLASSTHPEAQLPALACSYYVAWAEHDLSTIRAIADGAARGFPNNGVGAMDIGVAYARAGDIAKSIGWFETAYEVREPQIFATPYGNRELVQLLADPRWKAYREKPAFKEWQAARAEIAKRFQMGE